MSVMARNRKRACLPGAVEFPDIADPFQQYHAFRYVIERLSGRPMLSVQAFCWETRQD